MGIVVLTTVPTELEAGLVCGLMRANDIEAFQRYGATTLGGVQSRFANSWSPHQVVVDELDPAAARALLAAPPGRDEPA